MLQTLIEYVASPILVALMGWVVFILKEQKKSTSAQEKGLMLLLRREIIGAHKRFCEIGEPMTALDYATVCEMNEAYQKLGGNGMTEKLFAEIKAVEITGGEER